MCVFVCLSVIVTVQNDRRDRRAKKLIAAFWTERSVHAAEQAIKGKPCNFFFFL